MVIIKVITRVIIRVIIKGIIRGIIRGSNKGFNKGYNKGYNKSYNKGYNTGYNKDLGVGKGTPSGAGGDLVVHIPSMRREGVWCWARAPSSGAGGALGVGWDTPNGWWGRVGGLWEVGMVTTGRRMAENP